MQSKAAGSSCARAGPMCGCLMDRRPDQLEKIRNAEMATVAAPREITEIVESQSPDTFSAPSPHGSERFRWQRSVGFASAGHRSVVGCSRVEKALRRGVQTLDPTKRHGPKKQFSALPAAKTTAQIPFTILSLLAFYWRARRDSNLRPSESKSAAAWVTSPNGA